MIKILKKYFSEMPKNKIYYYAVKKGRKNGIYTSWDEARLQVDGYPNSIHKKFSNV